MAIADTGNIFKAFMFDGESSRKYGVYITGEAVYNAPERDVEMITIAGRNGAYALDKGRFANIEVRYTAGIFADTEDAFSQAVSDFRNFLCSKKGYCRLSDEYNPDEYRMAIYKSGLEVTPANRKAGTFEIAFDCKPQRYLESGEVPITAVSNKPIVNPTLFDAHPMLEITGYGDITIGDQKITLDNSVIGTITVVNGQRKTTGGLTTTLLTMTVDYSEYAPIVNTGDSLTGKIRYSGASVKANSPNNITFVDGQQTAVGTRSVSFNVANSFSFGAFPSSDQTSTFTDTHSIRILDIANLTNIDFTFTITSTVVNKTAGKLIFTVQVTTSTDVSAYCTYYVYTLFAEDVIINSSKTSLGNPTYVDCEIGEAYKIEDNVFVSLNDTVKMPAELPVLASGSNAIMFSNTVTNLKIIPRWWKI